MPDAPPPPEGTPPASPAPAAPAPSAPQVDSTTRLPDDHPLVKAFEATKVSLSEAKTKLAGFEGDTRTSGEKLAEATSRAEKAELALLRRDVADDKGLTAAQAKFLSGTTKEEIEAQAEEILKAFPTGNDDGDTKPPPARRPVADLKGGNDPNARATETDPAKLASTVPRR